VRPGRDVWQPPQARELQTARRVPDTQEQEAPPALDEEQRQLIRILQTQRDGMTVRQLESQFSGPAGEIDLVLESLIARQLVARLNTVIPSYVYRYGGVDLSSE
jgi:hypothetical protein